MSEYLINGNIYFVVIKEGIFSEFPSEQKSYSGSSESKYENKSS